MFALEEKPYLEVLIEREFAQEGDLEQAIALIKNSQGIQKSRELAIKYSKIAVDNIEELTPSQSRQTLINLANYVSSLS